ncbi:phosphotransferase [Nocardioides marmoribigeumensis]|uniref:Aminoglycoside phosphotransferase (APT) family kinase protein n=1 Tax=Nocardioides marmoribigeumensis TaxID=433649 RepID=A0ABU2C119_9ACTN|nr:phosphotransferase [Nocardioides marmoribigeumensis]MDR7364347.1 aminoglycoside phosphotransferase (APT) family kinase protein [Nocardioides marmoribigeumensis]
MPAAVEPALVHGDFRLGNLLVAPDGRVAVLDWELAHLGDPAEDLGWLCARPWRFGGPGEAAGLGSRDELLSAYASAGGSGVDPERLHFWEVLASLKWGVICQVQAARHTPEHPSLEHAAIGRRVT